MNITEKLQNSLAWFPTGKQGEAGARYDISAVLDLVNLNFAQGLEISEDGKIRAYCRNNNVGYASATDDVAATKPVVTEEVYFLTQVILNTLNSDPERYHNMLDIPGLETEGWNELASVAQYLITQGWVEPKTLNEKLLVKLTIQGKVYLRTNNAWS